MSSPRNESMERADLTMEDWIQETCLISAVTSGPTEPKTFQDAWHYPVESERDNWRVAIRKEIRSMIERGVWSKTDRKMICRNRRLIGNKVAFKIKREGTYRSLRYHHSSSASPLSMLSVTRFRHYHLMGLVPPLLLY